MKCTLSEYTLSEYTRGYRHSTYGIIAAILLSLMAIGIGMNQVVNGQYYDYETGTYHATNTSIHNVTSINMTTSGTQTDNSNGISRDIEIDALPKRKLDNIDVGSRSVDNLIKENQATESYKVELEAYIVSHNVDISSVKGMALSMDQLEAIVKEYIATGSATGAIADITNDYLAPAFETFGIGEKENDAK